MGDWDVKQATSPNEQINNQNPISKQFDSSFNSLGIKSFLGKQSVGSKRKMINKLKYQ